MMFSRKFRSGTECDKRGSECDKHESECDNHGSECDKRESECDKRGSECDKRGSEKREKTAEKGQILRKNDYLCKMKEKTLTELSAPLEVEVTDLLKERQYRLIKWQQTIKTTSSQ